MMQYHSYSPSGIAWLKDIPSHWEVKPLFTCLSERYYKNTGNSVDRVFSLSYGRIVLRDVDSNFGLLPESFETYQIVEEGNIVIRPTDLQNDKRSLRVGLVREVVPGIITSAYIALEAKQEFVPSYFYYLLLAYDLQKVFYGLGGGVRQSLKYADLKRLPLLVPSRQEQASISFFLDEKLSEIATLLKQKQQMLVLLQEEQASLINHAVTKGLDDTVPMRNSGIEWLGNVPAHWKVKRLKYLVQRIQGGGTPSTGNPDFWEGDIPWVSPKDMKSDFISATQDNITEFAIDNSSVVRIEPNSILMVVRSGILKRSLPVAINRVPVTLNQDLKAFIPASEVDTTYLWHMLKGLESEILTFCTKIGATVDSIEMEYLQNFEVPLAPPREQVLISDYITKEKKRIEEANATIKQEITLLQEYRTALIAEAVTGQIDVRNYEPALAEVLM